MLPLGKLQLELLISAVNIIESGSMMAMESVLVHKTLSTIVNVMNPSAKLEIESPIPPFSHEIEEMELCKTSIAALPSLNP